MGRGTRPVRRGDPASTVRCCAEERGATKTCTAATDAYPRGSLTDVHEPVFYGPDIATASDAVLRLRHAKDLLADLDSTMTGHALERLRATVAAAQHGQRRLLGARAWVVAAVGRRNGPARA